MPDQADIDRLRSWREARRPLECKRGKPCWVDDPYGTIVGGLGMHCVSCGGKPTFNAVAFSMWLADLSPITAREEK
jgi:hypothetical protein